MMLKFCFPKNLGVALNSTVNFSRTLLCFFLFIFWLPALDAATFSLTLSFQRPFLTWSLHLILVSDDPEGIIPGGGVSLFRLCGLVDPELTPHVHVAEDSTHWLSSGEWMLSAFGQLSVSSLPDALLSSKLSCLCSPCCRLTLFVV